MYCTECGTANADGESRCGQCGAALLVPPEAAAGGPIQNHLAAAILATLCCCVPLGIPAIVYAAGVNAKIVAGDVEGARQASRQAKMWAWISFGSGLAFWVVYLALGLVGAALGGLE